MARGVVHSLESIARGDDEGNFCDWRQPAKSLQSASALDGRAVDWISGRGMRQNLLEVATCVLVAVEEVKRQKKLCLRSMNSLMPSDFATTMGDMGIGGVIGIGIWN